MKTIDRIHGGYVFRRRVSVLTRYLAELLPAGARALDVGCGDGMIDRLIMTARPDVVIRGVDVLLRGETHIPVTAFDGKALPFDDDAFDAVMFVDVLHHTDDPAVLLAEAARVARAAVIVKDHTRNGLAAGATLRYMDRVGNKRHGVVLPYNYWPRKQWHAAFAELHLTPTVWHRRLRIYPFWADWLFGRSLHFIARLESTPPDRVG